MLAAASGPFTVYVNGHLAGRGLGSRETPVAVWEHFAMGTLLHEGENLILISVLGS